MKPGRNNPCPCGSGRKYKKCCLPRHEAERREIDQLELADLEAGAPAGWLDEDVEPDYDYTEDEIPLFDISAIRSIRYARGFVKRLDEAFEGRGLEVSVWTAPGIPQPVLDSIEREALAELEGIWGDPRAGTPIQVDTIEIETEDDFLHVEVFNRAIALVHGDGEELRRLHRVCGVLQQAAEEHQTDSTIAAAQPVQNAVAPPVFDLDDALKQHRHQGGACGLCGQPLKRTSAARHYAACAPEHDLPKGPIQDVIQLRITSPHLAGYWLDVEARTDATLEALDRFLRRTWLECCGHLSRFRVGNVEFFSRGYELNAWNPPGLRLGSARVERSMNARMGSVLPPIGGTASYEYDFGSSTHLVIKVTGAREGRVGRSAVRVLGRNTPLVWPCAVCGEAASLVCGICSSGDTNAFVCDAHAGDVHYCGEEAYLPVVNSPRVGVCGYTGEM